MSELPAGSVSLEDDNPTLESLSQPPPAPETPADAPAASVQEPDSDPEGTVVNPGGEKLVPLNVVADLRGKVRESKAALEAKEQEIAALRDKASKFDQVEGEWKAVQPLVQQIKNGTYQPPAPPRQQVNEKAVEYAKYLDLYKVDGTPDVDRAQKILELNAAQARETAQQLVQPIYATHAQAQSAAHFEQAANFKAPNGIQADREVLRQIWSQVPPDLSAQPGVAMVLWRQAIAESALKGGLRAPVTPPPPALVTESLGAPSPTTQTLTAADRNMMSAASIGQKDYEKISAQYKPGERNSLE
jgi:hypothetical protein